jgi:hypothetical protein
MRIAEQIIVVLSACILSGCAWTDVRPVSSADVRNQRGFVIYDQIPVLIVEGPDKDGKQAVRLSTMPNMDKPRLVNSYAVLAKNDLKLELDNGVLKGVTSNSDTTAFLDIVSSLLPVAEAAKFRGDSGQETPQPSKKLIVCPGIYIIQFDGRGNICRLDPFTLPTKVI